MWETVWIYFSDNIVNRKEEEKKKKTNHSDCSPSPDCKLRSVEIPHRNNIRNLRININYIRVCVCVFCRRTRVRELRSHVDSIVEERRHRTLFV